MSRETSSTTHGKNTTSNNTTVLLPDQCYPAQQMSIHTEPQNPDESLLDLDLADSDCDSSCLSIDVDDYFQIDEPIEASLPPKTSTKSCYIDHMIHNQVRAQMWGDDYSQTVSSFSGDCDVCNIMRMKRQKACTDLWTGPRGPFEDPSSLMSTVNYKTTLSSLPSQCSKRRRNSNDNLTTPAKKPHMSAELSTPCVSLRKRVKRPSKTPSKTAKNIHSELGSRESYLRKSGSELGERLHPEGSEDDKENIQSIVTSVWSSSSLHTTCSQNDSGFSSTNNSIKSKSDISGQSDFNSHYMNNLNTSSTKLYRQNHLSYENIPADQRLVRSVRSRSRKSLKHSSPFCDSIPTPSPWKGDKKLLKKKLKELSLNVQNQSNIQTLGCF
jgi:hypothetical protein